MQDEEQRRPALETHRQLSAAGCVFTRGRHGVAGARVRAIADEQLRAQHPHSGAHGRADARRLPGEGLKLAQLDALANRVAWRDEVYVGLKDTAGRPPMMSRWARELGPVPPEVAVALHMAGDVECVTTLSFTWGLDTVL